MRKNIYLLVLIIIVLIVSMNIFVEKNTKSHENEISKIIDKDVIEAEIRKSGMDDGGYRFINAEFGEEISAYATYYISEAKAATKLLEKPYLKEHEEKILIDKFLNTDKLELTDIYCVLELMGDAKKIDNKDKILEYLDSLYDTNIGCYTLTKTDNYDVNIYTTFIATNIALELGSEIKPIDEWLKKAEEELFIKNKVSKGSSNGYTKLFQLMKMRDMEISERYLNDVLQMFENSLKNKEDLESSKEVYLPVYLMDYLELCKLMNLNNLIYDKIITNVLCDGESIRENVIMRNDAYGLFATMQVLDRVSFDLKKDFEEKSVFKDFDKFILGEGLYIAPGNVESNFVDTYYADGIANILDIEIGDDIIRYFKTNKINLMDFNMTYNYNYLNLLARNNKMNLISGDKKAIIDGTANYIKALAKKENLANAEIETLSNALKCLNILGGKISIDKSKLDDIVKEFEKSENDQQSIYDIATIIDFIHLADPNKKDLIMSYCKELEKELIDSKHKDFTNKIILQSRSLEVLKKTDYAYSDNLVQIIDETLENAKDDNGLYKGGDSDDDIMTFRSNYEAIVMYLLINE